MKHFDQKENDNVVVLPSTRRGGSDAQSGNTVRQPIEKYMNSMAASTDLNAISDRILNYANSTTSELEVLKDAFTRKDKKKILRSAEKLANLSADIGANDMLRLAYKVLILAKKEEYSNIPNIMSSLSGEFSRFKSTLRLAT